MPEPAIVATMNRFRRQVQLGEDDAVARLATRWLQVEQALVDQIQLLAQEMADLRAAGKVVSQEMVFLMEHSQSMLLQVRQQVVRYAAFADDVITERQRALAQMGIDHATQAIQTVSVNAVFSRLNVAAVQNVIGLAGDGSPLRTLLEATYADGAKGILDVLIKGVAIGKSPRDMAKQAVRQGLSKSLDRMLVLMRTETLRVYRHTTMESYANSGIVDGWIWKASLSTRTCVGCLARDGSFHRLDEPFGSHPVCRCAPIPRVIGVAEPKFETGEQWLARQPEDVQRTILGPGRLAVYQSGRVPFAEFATERQDGVWGSSIVPTPLKSL